MQATRVAVDRTSLLDPSNAAWNQAVPEPVSLVPTPLELQPSPWIQGAFRDAAWGGLNKASLKVLHNGDLLATRVEWAVPQPATSTTGADEFADACAVMFPFVKDAPIVMGAEHQWVNMWLWRADGYGPFVVTAAGIGTTERTEDPILAAKGVRHNEHWQVVFVRPMEPNKPREHVPLRAGTHWQVALALWQGAKQERGGLKSYSPLWTPLDIAR